MVLAIVLVLIAVGSVIFHFWSPWWFTPIASNWGSMDDAINITFAITGVAYVAIILFMAYCIYKYRYREDRRADYEPENSKLEWWLTWVTAAGVVGLLTPGLIAWNEFVTVPEDATEFEVVGSQWEWKYRLPGKDGKLGTSSIKLISDDNPFGLNPKDPNSKDDILIEGEDLHLPLNKPIKMLLRSVDVLHDFYVPQFRAKMDLVPGMVTFFWLTTTRTGTFDILCAELCGVGHHAMRGQVVVDDTAAFQKWLGGQKSFATLYPKGAAGTQQAAESDAEIKTVLTANKQNNEEGK
ncbi:MAG: cytochrome c oxidase subunit II [Rhodospirillaceae bacterium]|nr:cytochrome c oxidase subunit II [Rhodospirillaceae bacterium]